MIRVAAHLAGTDLRRSPGRALAVAVLLLVAALLPGILRQGTAVGLVLAVVVAASATAGAAAQHERRARILAENGARSGAQALVAVAALVVPGALAAVAAIVVGLVTDGPPGIVTALAVTLVVPALVAAVAAWATAPGASLGRRGTVAVIVLAALTAPLLVVPLVLLAVLVGPRLGRAALGLRIAITLVAVATTVGAAVLMSGTESFFDLGFVLLGLAIPLTVAVGWLGTTAVAGVAALVARLGPTARLATAPLGRRRRQLGPVAAVVAVVATLAAAEGVVGASFEEREARRPAPEALGPAGSSDDQAIVITTGILPDDERRIVAEAATGQPVQVAVIDRIGGGSTQATPDREPDEIMDLGAVTDLAPEVSVPVAGGPSWVGVVDPEALGPLGLADHAEALARGDALVLNAQVEDAGGRVVVSGGATGPLTLPGVRTSGPTGLLLPAVLISEARGAELGGPRNGARAVVTPGPGAEPVEAHRVADAIHTSLADAASPGPEVVPGLDSTSAFGALLEHQLSVSTGEDELRESDIARLDAVPALARTADQGRARAVTFGGLAVLVALAGTLLVAGGARGEDAVLLIQGAPDRFRVLTAVIQTTTVTLAGTALGALVGLGIPALAMTLYNGRERDARTLDIPYVLPSGLLVLLAALPVVAALLAAAVVATRGRPSARLLADATRA